MFTKDIIRSKEKDGHRNLFLRRLFNQLHGGNKKQMRDKNILPKPFAITLSPNVDAVQENDSEDQIFLGPVMFNHHYFVKNKIRYENDIDSGNLDADIYDKQVEELKSNLFADIDRVVKKKEREADIDTDILTQ